MWRVGDDPDAPWVRSTAPRHAHLAGFDLHANVAVPAAARTRLEQLCRHLLRPAVAQDRLRLLTDGRVLLTLKTAWADGTRHLIFEPLTLLELDTEGLADGPHRLRVRAIEDSGTVGVEVIPFAVRNGPGIAVVGLADGDTVRGRIPLLVNAFASRPGDTFEPVRAETPAPIPTWAWVLFLLVAAWGMWFVATEVRSYRETTMAAARASGQASTVGGAGVAGAAGGTSQSPAAALGKQVYENKCAACHQLTGLGLPGVFPPLKDSAVVTAADPTEHIRTVLRGLSGKAIGGVTYGSAMPAFADQLTDEEVAAVLTHERTSWGHQAKPVKPEDVVARR